jgi:hypothetical protein
MLPWVAQILALQCLRSREATRPRRSKPVPSGNRAAQKSTSAPGEKCRIYHMDDYYNKFVELIRPFQALWNSARLTCIAVGPPGERRSVVTRFVFRGEALPEGQAFQKVHWLQPTPEVLISVVDFAKPIAAQVLFKAIAKYHIDLETDSTVDRVLLRWPLPGSPADNLSSPRLSSFSWQDSDRYQRQWAMSRFGEDRTCLAITGTGDYIRNLMPDQLCREVSSKLLLNPPHFGGIDAVYQELLPGVGYDSSNLRIFEAVFPLPFDLEQTGDGRLALRVQTAAANWPMQIIVKFNPGKSADKIQVTSAGAARAADNQGTKWTWNVSWPRGAESGKASLFVAGEEITSIDLRRWPAAGSLRAAVDCYFDAEHKFLRQSLFGENQKINKGHASQAFEMAVVRSMNLLGIPLVWYGKGVSVGRNDAAGVVDRKQGRVVVLAECATEKPEAKFSALRDRAQKLGGWLAGEAEVLPVVFTQVDPPWSVFEAAVDHGIALVGRTELGTLFNMLPAITREKDALGFLKGLRSSIQFSMTRRGAI